MTREEAAGVLAIWKDKFRFTEGGELVIDLAIEALKQPEPCEDAVSRFKVLMLIENSSNDLADSVDNRYLQNEVKKLPPVTPAILLAKISFDKDNLDEMAKEAAQKIKEQLTATKAAPATPPVYAVSADDVIENMEAELEMCNKVRENRQCGDM